MRIIHTLALILVLWLATSLGGTISVIEAVEYLSPPDLKDLRPAESLVLEKVTQGEPADLSELRKKYGDADTRTKLRGRFLEALLGGEFQRLLIHKEGIRIINAEISGPVKLEYETSSYMVEFMNCHFRGQIFFTDCIFQRNLKLDGSTFDKEAKFYGTQIKGELMVSNVDFEGEAGFVGVEVGRSAYFGNTKFRQSADFLQAIIGEDLSFVVAQFFGEAVFTGVQIGREFQANGVKFFNDQETVNFSRLEVKELTNLTNSVFKGPVDFSKAKIGDATVVGEEVKGVIAERVEFAQSAKFDGAQLSELIFRNADIRDLKLVGATVEQRFSLEYADITTLDASHLVVKGQTFLKNLHISKSANFTASRFQTLQLIDSPTPGSLKLGGMTYQALTPPETGIVLFKWIEKSDFDTQDYVNLEDYSKRSGHEALADNVFISLKKRELQQKSWRVRWLVQFFWGWPVGYGRQPWRVLYVIVPLIAMGTFLFAPKFDEKFLTSNSWLKGMSSHHPWIIKFLLSLDRFLPGVDLGLAKEWSPQKVNLITFLSWHVLKLAGWITIPIVLAAIYTQIK